MPVARLANSGVSVFIDQYGHFDGNTEIFTDRVIQRKVPLRTRDTVYTHIGDAVEMTLLVFGVLYLLVALLVAWLQARKTRKVAVA
jgi:apolipoprotein N-acyltransferase